VMGNVDPDLPHRLYGQRVNRRRGGPSRAGLETVGQIMIHKPFGHLASRTVLRADEKDPFHIFALCAMLSALSFLFVH